MKNAANIVERHFPESPNRISLYLIRLYLYFDGTFTKVPCTVMLSYTRTWVFLTSLLHIRVTNKIQVLKRSAETGNSAMY